MSANRYVWFLRGTTYATGGLLGALILTAAMPPLLSATSKRAVINAPLIALTAPIDGTIGPVAHTDGADLQTHETVFEIENRRIEQGTLTHLQIRQADVADRRDRAAAAARTLQREVALLEETIAQKKAEQVRLLDVEIERASAELAAREALVAVSKEELSRQKRLTERAVVSSSLEKEARSRVAAALGERNAVRASLSLKERTRTALANGIFVGETLTDLAALENELRARRVELEDAEGTRGTAASHFDALELLVRAEQERIAQRTSSPVRAPFNARLLTTFVTENQDVRAGATLAHAVNCGRQRVVAIFPQRHADSFSPGQPMTVRAAAWDAPVQGYVERTFPERAEMVDRLYAVPFPPIERRELYVVIAFDDQLPRTGQSGCPVGEWVSVDASTGIFPSAIASMQSAWQMVSNAVLGPSSAEAAMHHARR